MFKVKNIKKIFALGLILSMTIGGDYAKAAELENPVFALDFFDEDAVMNMDEETREVYSTFEVGNVESESSYVMTTLDENSLETSIDVDKNTFFTEVLKQNVNTPVDIAMKVYDNNVRKAKLNEAVNGNTSSFSTVDTDSSGSVITTTLINSSSISNYNYIVKNEVWSTQPLVVKRVINGIGLNSNSSIINNYYIAYHKYTLYSSTGTENNITDYYEPSCKNADGYAFDYNVYSGVYSNYSVLSVYAEPNVSNLTIFDGYGLTAYTSMSADVSISIDVSGPSLSITPSKSWTKNNTHVQHIR